jgi:hypothetical protein
MKILLISILLLLYSNCDLTEIQRQEKKVAELWDELVELSESVSCTNPEEWRAAPVGHKACGGPAAYLPYSVNIDTTRFLDLARQHREESRELNRLTGALSDCSVAMPPNSISCIAGKAELNYN